MPDNTEPFCPIPPEHKLRMEAVDVAMRLWPRNDGGSFTGRTAFYVGVAWAVNYIFEQHPHIARQLALEWQQQGEPINPNAWQKLFPGEG